MALPHLILFGIDWLSFGINFANFYALYFAISLTLNLEAGFTGIPNFGKVLFVAGGAAFAGSVSGRVAAYFCALNAPTICNKGGDFITFNADIISQVNGFMATNPIFTIEIVIIALATAASVGAFLGFLVSYPAIRLREDYLGMLLLASAQFFQIFLRAYGPIVGGTQGIFAPDPFLYFSGLGIGYRDLAAAVAVSGFAVLVYLYSERIARSPLGRMLKAVRDNEDASRALGKNDVAIRRKVLIIASAIAGLAGAFVTFYSGSVGADTWDRFAWTFWPWLIIIIGGMGNNKGVALGALFFTLVTRGLQQAQPFFQPYLPFDPNWLTYLVFATLLILVLMIRPEGILRERPTPTLPQKTLRSIVGSAGLESGGAPPSSEEGGRAKRALSRLRKVLSRKPTSSGPPSN
jgi:branched-chain amino acid transport system permease protein